MKTKIITIALITITSFANQLIAQETAALKTRTKSNACNERTTATGKHIPKAILVCRVTPADNGCIITMEHSVKSPRDAASGLPTGKRMHKPFVITKELDKSSSSAPSSEIAIDEPGVHKVSSDAVEGYDLKAAKKIASRVAGGSSDSPPSEIAIDESGVHKSSNSGAGSGKASFSDLSVMSAGKATFKEFTVTKRCDGKTTKIVCSSGECEIPLDDCPNGTCDLVCDWSWGLSQQGTMSSSGSAGFSLEIQDGACTAMAINEKGLPGEKKPNKTTTNNPK